jgi:type VI secretion system secreted protein VgrG
MASPKSGKAGTPVQPAAPTAAQEADNGDPGMLAALKALQQRTQTGQYGAIQARPYKPPATPAEKEQKSSWIEIEMVDADDHPVPGEPYRITLSDESVIEGTLDEKGCARIEGIEPGSCQITFPNLDKEAWEKL